MEHFGCSRQDLSCRYAMEDKARWCRSCWERYGQPAATPLAPISGVTEERVREIFEEEAGRGFDAAAPEILKTINMITEEFTKIVTTAKGGWWPL